MIAQIFWFSTELLILATDEILIYHCEDQTFDLALLQLNILQLIMRQKVNLVNLLLKSIPFWKLWLLCMILGKIEN
jgi:hypothetical protein